MVTGTPLPKRTLRSGYVCSDLQVGPDIAEDLDPSVTRMFRSLEVAINVSSHYVISAEANPQVVKVVQDTGRAWHAGGRGQTWWGEPDVNNFSIGIELSHKAKTPWPDAQISALMGLLEMLLNAYPSIKRYRIAGHTDVLLIDRDCPGLEFDWAVLEKFGLGMVPDGGAMSLDNAYGGFFRLRPTGHLRKTTATPCASGVAARHGQHLRPSRAPWEPSLEGWLALSETMLELPWGLRPKL
jgi:N-acetylmuramoyl-L-alanine amidase-like protein